jgi:cell division septation protein DedD/nucleoid DNA-binding protein
MIPPKLIAEYFYEFKKVSFEGIGTLERKHKSAKVDMADKVFVPPTAYIEFNHEVSGSDAFVKYISVTQNLTEKEAQLKIQQFVTQLKAVLETKNEYSLDKLGKFLYNKNTKQITFQQNPDAFANSPFYFGLGEAHFLPVSRGTLSGSDKNEVKKEEIQKAGSNFNKNATNVAKITAQELKKSLEAIEKKEEEEKTEKKSSKRMLIIGISTGIISLFIVLVFGLSYFFPSLDALHVYHNKTKQDSVKSKSHLTVQDSTHHQTQQDTAKHENKTHETHTDTHKSNTPTDPSIVNESTGNSGAYYIIVASFTNTDIANQHLNMWRNKGFDAHIATSHQGNKYRLYVHQSDKEQDALTSLTQFKSKIGRSDLWILYQ